MTMRYAVTAVAALLLAACAMPQGGMMMKKGSAYSAGVGGAPTDQYVDESFRVETVPSGAQVRVNGVGVGVSPVNTSVRRYWRGQAGNMALDMVKVEALPAASGQCVQSGVFGQNNLRLPSPVRFTMNACGGQGYGSVRPPAGAQSK